MKDAKISFSKHKANPVASISRDQKHPAEKPIPNEQSALKRSVLKALSDLNDKSKDSHKRLGYDEKITDEKPKDRFKHPDYEKIWLAFSKLKRNIEFLSYHLKDSYDFEKQLHPILTEVLRCFTKISDLEKGLKKGSVTIPILEAGDNLTKSLNALKFILKEHQGASKHVASDISDLDIIISNVETLNEQNRNKSLEGDARSSGRMIQNEIMPLQLTPRQAIIRKLTDMSDAEFERVGAGISEILSSAKAETSSPAKLGRPYRYDAGAPAQLPPSRRRVADLSPAAHEARKAEERENKARQRARAKQEAPRRE